VKGGIQWGTRKKWGGLNPGGKTGIKVEHKRDFRNSGIENAGGKNGMTKEES